MALLSVDIGTTSTKALIFSERGEIIASSYQEYPISCPKPGWAELDAETIWTAFRKTVWEVTRQHKKQVAVLCLSCMGHSIVPVRHDGTPISNGILASDTRATKEVEIIRNTFADLEYFRIRGSRPRPMDGLSKIMWLKTNRPDIFRQTWKFMTFADFIRTRLGFPAVIDYSMAASSLPYDVQKKDYSEVLLNEFGLNRQMFSEPVSSDEILGEIGLNVRTELNLPKGVKVVSGGHDICCGILGAGITQATPQIIVDIAGTWESMACVKLKPLLTRRSLETNVNSSCNIVRNTYIATTAQSTSGSIIRWFRDELASEDRRTAQKDGTNVYDIMFNPLKFDGGTVMAIPYFAGSYNDSYAKGALLGLTLGTSRQQVLQALVEGVTHGMKELVDRLDKLSPSLIEVIRAIGGPTKSGKWLQLKADISGKKVEALQIEEASALGAAILAGVAIGVYDSYEQAIKAMVKIKATYQPRPEIHQIYKRQHEIYKRLVESLKLINKELYYM